MVETHIRSVCTIEKGTKIDGRKEVI